MQLYQQVHIVSQPAPPPPPGVDHTLIIFFQAKLLTTSCQTTIYFPSYLLLLCKEIKDYESDVVPLGTSHDRARTLSTDGSFAGAWLHSVRKHYERHFSNDEFRKDMWLRLGIDNQILMSMLITF